MIDTDKYEGRSKHTAWRTSWGEPYDELNWLKENDECKEVDVQVLADAPLFLEEIKRLRERLIRAYDWAENAVNGNDSAMMDYTEYVCGGDEE